MLRNPIINDTRSVGRGLAPAEKITRIKYCFRRLVGKPPYMEK
ncbi:MAG: hypothetical protein SPJ42_09875 [Oscillospiraceae bacterium]|nr:hypothetical protein [Oscillospiraceae bacterium]